MSQKSVEADPLVAAYARAKAEHDAAIAAVKASARGRNLPDPELLRRQGAAAAAEFKALQALRGRRPQQQRRAS